MTPRSVPHSRTVLTLRQANLHQTLVAVQSDSTPVSPAPATGPSTTANPEPAPAPGSND